MSRLRVFPKSGKGRFPRVSGDEPFREALAQGQISFSPRERG